MRIVIEILLRYEIQMTYFYYTVPLMSIKQNPPIVRVVQTHIKDDLDK